MKKIIIFCLTLAMLLSMSVSLLAENGGFIQSPSNNQSPELISGENAAEDCLAQILITAYADREKLTDEKRTKLEEAYKNIKENPDLSKLNEKLQAIANDNDVDVTNLAVSDMFDISSTYCGDHDGHGHFDIVLKAETLEHFVCLLHYYNDEWTIVEGAEVTHNGDHLEFDAKEFSPFAIVVNTGEPVNESPSNAAIYAIIIAVIALILLFFAVKSKKKSH